MTKIPPDDQMIILEGLYKLGIRESEQLKTVLELYEMEIHQKISMPIFQKLKTMVKRRKDQKLRLRNFDARHGKIETWAVVKSRKSLSGVVGGKGTCYQWKEKGQCSKGDQCSFRHMSDDRAPKPTPKAAPPSEPSMTRGGSASRKKEASESEVRLAEFFDNRADTIWKVLVRDHLVSIGILPNVNSFRKNRDAKQGTSVCSRTTRLKNNQVKKQKKTYPQNGKSDDKGSVAVVKNCITVWLCLARLRAIRTSEKREVSGKPEAKSLGIDSKRTVHSVHATSSKYPRK